MSDILIIDDESSVLKMINKLLTKNGFNCKTADSFDAAIKSLKHEIFDIALCDVQLGDESGLELVKIISEKYPETGIIMVTGVDDILTAETAIRAGTYGYILKPFNINELIINVRNALKRRELEIRNERYRKNLERMVAERTDQWWKVLVGTIKAMSQTVEIRDPYTAGHQHRVAVLATTIAEEMNLSSREKMGIYLAGIVHDLGKISVPAEILSKPGKLNEAEFNLIKNHPLAGYEILKAIEFPWPIAETVFQHHEKINGTGYPKGLFGDGIILEAKVLCVADVVEAMASHRPYRPGLGIDKALGEVSGKAGVLYDEIVVKACLRVFKKKKFDFNRKFCLDSMDHFYPCIQPEDEVSETSQRKKNYDHMSVGS